MRTVDEIRADVEHALVRDDNEALLRYAAELDEIGSPAAEAAANYARASAAYRIGDYPLALQNFHRALELFEDIGDIVGKADTTTKIGILYRKKGDYKEALEYYSQALELYDSIGERSGVANVTANIGVVLWGTGDNGAALEHFHRALAVHEEIGSKGNAANVVGNIGLVYMRLGDYPRALEYFLRALDLHSQLGNRNAVASLATNIGAVYAHTGNDTLALEYYHQARELSEEVGDRNLLASVLDNIGIVHYKVGDPHAALDHHQRSLAIHEELGNRRGIATVTANIMSLHLDTGFDDEAQVCLERLDAMQIDEPAVRILREANRAVLLKHRGDLDSAAETLHRALYEAIEHDLSGEVAEIHKFLRDLAQKRNDFAGYIEHNNEFTRITEEINGKETAAKLATQTAERTVANERTERERERAVLYSTLPKHIADRVIRGEVVNDHIDNAAVMFVDIVGFTTLSSTLTSQQVITLLDAVFKVCDEACAQHNVTRIKTIGDSYLAVAMPSLVPRDDKSLVPRDDNSSLVPRDDSAFRCSLNAANAALQIAQQIKSDERVCLPDGGGISVRIGLHPGPVTAGVLGTERLQYDVWGDTVNVASRMESTSEPNRIHVTEQFAQSLSPLSAKERGLGESSLISGTWHLALRGETAVKGKGTMTTYWLENATR